MEEPKKTYQALRSESVQEIIAYRPFWLIRWGTSLFSVFFVILFTITFFVSYPDLLRSPLVLTAAEAPKAIVTKTGGKLIKLFVKENSVVAQNQVLAYLEATANHDEVLRLSEVLNKIQVGVKEDNLEELNNFKELNFSNLGELQPEFQQFEQSLTQLQSLTSNGFYAQKKNLLRNELSQLQNLANKLNEQRQIYQRDFNLAEKEFSTQQRLAKQGIISNIELSREESKMLSRQLPLKQVETSLINNQNEQSYKSKELLDLDKNLYEQKSFTKEALKTLISNVNTWKNKYILFSPVAGQIFFQKTLQENQVLAVNQELFFVGNGKPTAYLGEMKVAQDNFGKMKLGQSVIVRFNSYPSEEYGTVKGEVANISQIPESDNTYLVRVKFPEGLTTNYHKNLIFRNGMLASADIIIEEKTLADKILYQFRRAIQR